MPPVGQMFTDRYELGPEIGRGGMADVFLAHDRLLERDVAVKVLSPDFSTDPTFVARFRREAHAAANLSHPNVVAVYDWGEDASHYFIVMEYVAGRTLRDVLNTYPRLPAMEAARITAEIADALSFAHHNGVVHRDVKPGNVLLASDGQVKVADFGIVRAEQSDDLTKTGSVMGTATYFSPEQAQGFELDGRSDVYALGVVLYEMLTGRPPFVADNPVSVAYKHVHEAPVPPSRVNPDVPAVLDRAVLTAMAKDPRRRYQSAEDLRADLLRFERGRPLLGGPDLAAVEPAAATLSGVPITPTPRPVTMQPVRRRRRWGAVVTVLIVFALLISFIGVLLAQTDLGEEGGVARPTVAVPLLLGQPYAQAEATLVGQGFAVARAETTSDQAPDQVLDQQPEAGSKLTKGGTVTLTVSSTTIPMPDLVGKTREEASALLQQAKLTGFAVEQDSADKPPGTVLSTIPVVGERIPKPAPGQPNPVVTLNIAKEPPALLPNVKGQDPGAATTLLAQAGFLSVQPANAPSDTVPAGKVVDSDPPSGSPAPKTAVIRLLISTGPDTIAVPSVVGDLQDDAAAELNRAGFNVTIVPTTSTPENKGKVITQTPAPGTRLRRLDNVTITVGS